MKERPIIFSAPMVRAILDDRKVQTRRVVADKIVRFYELNLQESPEVHERRLELAGYRCPKGQPGDRLWVREMWCNDDAPAGTKPSEMRANRAKLYYRADIMASIGPVMTGWFPSIYMPRWASRIDLEITGVRVERLQEITEEGAQAEGVGPGDRINGQFTTYAYTFLKLWNKINGKRAPWNSNPWVFVIEFRRMQNTKGTT